MSISTVATLILRDATGETARRFPSTEIRTLRIYARNRFNVECSLFYVWFVINVRA